jgi:hypothetical protein
MPLDRGVHKESTMKTKNDIQRSFAGQLAPAFLSSDRGFEPQTTPPLPLRGWTPPSEVRRVENIIETLPKLTTSLGLELATRSDVKVELLPGSPTIVAYTAGGKLCGLMVLPVDGDDVSRLIGLPVAQTSDLVADRLWEESRQADALTPDSFLDDLTTWQP